MSAKYYILSQNVIWAAAEKNLPLAVSELIPAGSTGTHIWEGVHSLPMFRRFQKRVTATDNAEHLAGYNEQAMKWLTGPGCFTVRATTDDEPGSIVFDYTITPTVTIVGCKRVLPANRGLSRLAYGGMLDFMHRISRDVVIGRAWVKGKETNNYFVLVRGPEATA